MRTPSRCGARGTRRWLLFVAIAAIVAIAALASLGSAVRAAPFVPERDDEILERLPFAGDLVARDPVARELRSLGERLARDPGNLELATRLARRYVEVGRAESDPRYFGWAEGALLHWQQTPEPPLEVLLLRATLRQNRHEFDAALADLDSLLARDPRSAGGWLLRAAILQVRGDLAGAQRSCVPLLRLADALTATTCLAGVASLQGRAEQSYALLRRALDASRDASPDVLRWSLTSLAEIAERLGWHEEAERLYGEARATGGRDAYLLSDYADFLLDRERPAEVVELLASETRADGLLLRLALAEQRLHSPALEEHVAALRARFAASRTRAGALHRGEEARFTLHLLHDPPEALRLARANFAVQRELRDARVLLEAAVAAEDPTAARPVLRLLEETSLEDVALRRLAARVEALR